jgi:hypothetical protein
LGFSSYASWKSHLGYQSTNNWLVPAHASVSYVKLGLWKFLSEHIFPACDTF